MASIKVKYRPSSIAGNEGTIYYQIIHERMIRQVNTLYRILPNEWDKKCQMVRPAVANSRKVVIQSIRQRIRWDMERIKKIERRMVEEGLPYTAQELVDEFTQYKHEYTLANFMSSLIIKLKADGKTRTSETYTSALNSFERFLTEATSEGKVKCAGELMLDNLTPELIESFEAWHKGKGNTPNTVSFYTRILRAVYNRAVEAEIIEDRSPFRRVFTGVEKTVKRALPLSFMKRISILDLSLSPRLDYARDMFLLSFFLRGMSFIDMSFLKKSDLKNGYVVYRRRKTGQQLTIAWTAEMQKIVDKYPANPTQYLLPIIRKEGMNERSVYRNVGYRINHNLKEVGKLMDIAIPLTMYVARHSWASAAKAKGIPVSVISEGMGHNSETTTQIYLASLDTSAVDKANAVILKSLR